MLVDLENRNSELLENYPCDLSRLFLYVQAHCTSCAMMQASDASPRCAPLVFLLPPSIESPIKVLMVFDDFNTWFSQTATFKIPPRYRKPSNGQWFRCGRESLVYVFSLIPSLDIDVFACSISFALRDWFGNDVATCQLETPLKTRTHGQVQMLALPQASPDFGSTVTTAPPPQIVDINPRSGLHSAGQRVWVKVLNLPRGNGQRYLIEFDGVGIVSTSFESPEGDQVQILECTTPITPTPCGTLPALKYYWDPQSPIGSSDVQYFFTAAFY